MRRRREGAFLPGNVLNPQDTKAYAALIGLYLSHKEPSCILQAVRVNRDQSGVCSVSLLEFTH